MQKKNWYKIISIISAIALLLSSISGIVTISAADTKSALPDVTALIEENLTPTNDTTQDDLDAVLLDYVDEVLQESGYYYSEITEFYKMKALGGAYEIGSANGGSQYTGAPVNDEVLVAGIDGYISAVIALEDDNGDITNTVVTLKIEAPMEGYTFTSCSNTIDHWSGDNSAGYSYTKGDSFQKVVVPDEITKITGDTFSWKNSIKCIIYGAGLTSAPRMLASRAVEVIAFKNPNTTLAFNAFDGQGKEAALKYVQLPANLKDLPDKVYNYCPNLVNFYLPEGLDRIRGSIFYNYGDHTAGKPGILHSLTEITIPSTVTYIDNNAFAGASVPCEVTILSKSTNLWNANAFYNAANPTLGSNYSLRVFKSSTNGTADVVYQVATPEQKTYINDTMTLAEATARAAFQAGVESKTVYADADAAIAVAESVVSKVTSAYGNNSNYTATLANEDWDVGLSSISNVLTLTDGTNTSAVELAIPFVYAGFDGEITATNATTENSLKAQLEEATGAEIEITDFYKIKSMPEVVEVGSTYPGAVDGLVLVPGETGYVSAYYNITDDYGTVSSASVLIRIAPERVERAYTSVSNSMTDWEETAAGNGIWRYKGGKVDKLIVPDEITALQSSYWPTWHNDADIKCVVIGTGVTTLPANTGLKAEVVSFKGNNVKKLSAAFHTAKNLKYIHLPEGLEQIGVDSFRKVTTLEYLYIPQSVTNIGSNIFYKPSEDNNADGTLNTTKAHNITDITVPVNVKGLGAYSFTGAAKDCTITVLSLHNESSWEAFYDTSFDSSIADKIYVRAFAGTAIQLYCKVVNPVEKLKDTMGLAEINARAQQAADKNSNKTYDSADAIAADAESILTAVKNSYNVSGYSAAWKNQSWAGDNGFLFNNTIVITVGEDTVEIPVAVKKSGEFDLQTLVESQNITVDNNTTKDVLADKLAGIGLSNYDIEVIDFYKLNAIDGACEVVGDTTEVLVPGEKGYIAAVIKITGANGASITSNLLLDIDYAMEEYTFNSVSNSINDWEANASGAYIYKGGAVDKLIIPDEITALQVHWHNWQSMRCIVYGEGIKSTGSAAYMNVEVVVFKGNTEKIGGWSFGYATKLKYIALPESLVTIDDEAFKGCTSLKALKLPSNLKTLGKYFLGNPTDAKANAHNLTQLVVPASVDTIRADAFSCAVNPFEIIILGKNTTVYPTSFYNANNADYCKNNIVRVFKDSAVDTNTVTAAGNKLYLDDMTVSEAAARAASAADALSDDILVDVEKTETILENAYFNVSGITKEWKLDKWNEDGNTTSNTLVLSDGANSFGVDITMLAPTGFYSDGIEILDSAAWKTNNYKQGLRFYNSFKSSAADKVSIEGVEYTVKDFGVLIKHIANDSVTAGAATMDDASFVKGAIGVICESGAENSITRDNDTNKNQFSVYVKNIPQGGRNYYFQTRGYITYTDANGEDVTIYTNSQVTSAKAEFDILSSNADYSGMSDWFSGKIS